MEVTGTMADSSGEMGSKPTNIHPVIEIATRIGLKIDVQMEGFQSETLDWTLKDTLVQYTLDMKRQ